MRLLLFLALLFGCHPAKRPLKKEPTPDISQVYAQVRTRLLTQFAPDGWVVSKFLGQPFHQGDSLIWSGIAMSVLPCKEAQPIVDALSQMLLSTGGAIYRHPTMKDRASLDGALGLYYGIAYRMLNCDEKEYWRPLIDLHRNYVKSHHDQLNELSEETLTPGFDYVLDMLAYVAGLRAEPTADAMQALQIEISTWAAATVGKHAACYRIHLGELAMETVESLGASLNAPWKAGFCHVTEHIGLASVDDWCGIGGLADFIDRFQYNRWEFSLQRCKWEEPDGRDGLETPALDLLVAIKKTYAL